MIPKIIHYCWFGGKPLPKSARRCIASWQKYLPDYEIKEWNESNFDVNMIPYTAEAYAAKKFAFVSDFARFWVMHEHGGVYFDTDVEVIRSLDKILASGAFFAMEQRVHPQQEQFYVAPGLGCACEPNNPVWKELIDVYSEFPHFDYENQGTVCVITTKILARRGINLQGSLLKTEQVSIYPPDYFCPQAMFGAPINITDNTYSIHHFDCTWLPCTTRLRMRILSALPESWKLLIRRLLHRP